MSDEVFLDATVGKANQIDGAVSGGEALNGSLLQAGPVQTSGILTVNEIAPDSMGNVQVTVEIDPQVFDLISDPDPRIMYIIRDTNN